MRQRTKIALALIIAACLLIGFLDWLANHHQPAAFEPGPIVITFLGYTNPPAASDLRFARFAISNHCAEATELMGQTLDVKGRPVSVTPIPDFRLPETALRLLFKLKPGEATNLVVREPKEAADGGQWRLYVFSKSHHRLQPLWDFASQHGLSMGILKRGSSLISCGPWLETPRTTPHPIKAEPPQPASTQ